MKRTAAQLTNVLDALTAQAGHPGAYAAARNVYAGVARLKEAAELGRTVFRPGAHADFMAEVNEFNGNEAERVALLAGLRDALLERAYGASDGANLYRQLLGNKGVRERIAAVFGPLGARGAPSRAAQSFFARVRREAERLVRINQVYSRNNSQTAPRMMEQEATDEALADAMVNLLTGNTTGTALQLARRLGAGLLGQSAMTGKEAAHIVHQTIRPLRAPARNGRAAAAADNTDDAMDPTQRMDLDEFLKRYATWAQRAPRFTPYHARAAQAVARGAVGYSAPIGMEPQPSYYDRYRPLR
jgi:hypothetical protein